MTKRGALDKQREKQRQPAAVMVVDDDDNWCFIMQVLLKQAGARESVLTAANGLSAIKLLQQLKENGEQLPELILLDIKMPVLDGFGFLEEVIKTQLLNPTDTRVYLCSSSNNPHDIEKAQSFPVTGFLTKPVTPEKLQEILG